MYWTFFVVDTNNIVSNIITCESEFIGIWCELFAESIVTNWTADDGGSSKIKNRAFLDRRMLKGVLRVTVKVWYPLEKANKKQGK